jgi:hypothetical protein
MGNIKIVNPMLFGLGRKTLPTIMKKEQSGVIRPMVQRQRENTPQTPARASIKITPATIQKKPTLENSSISTKQITDGKAPATVQKRNPPKHKNSMTIGHVK